MRSGFLREPALLQEAARDGFIVPIGGELIGWHGDPSMPEPSHLALHEFFHVFADGFQSGKNGQFQRGMPQQKIQSWRQLVISLLAQMKRSLKS